MSRLSLWNNICHPRARSCKEMLDPFSCLSIATATCAFIDFGSKVLKTAGEIQRTKGTAKEIVEFQDDVERFKTLCTDLRAANTGNVATIKADGHTLTDVAEKCEKLSVEVLALLEKFDVHDASSKIRNLKLAFKVHIKSSEVEQYEQQLAKCKVDLCTHLLSALSMPS